MMPELLHGLHDLGHDTGYPIGFLFILIGYLVILCLERVLFGHTHEHSHEEGLFSFFLSSFSICVSLLTGHSSHSSKWI
jgi:hypothetical protein